MNSANIQTLPDSADGGREGSSNPELSPGGPRGPQSPGSAPGGHHRGSSPRFPSFCLECNKSGILQRLHSAMTLKVDSHGDDEGRAFPSRRADAVCEPSVRCTEANMQTGVVTRSGHITAPGCRSLHADPACAAGRQDPLRCQLPRDSAEHSRPSGSSSDCEMLVPTAAPWSLWLSVLLTLRCSRMDLTPGRSSSRKHTLKLTRRANLSLF